MKEVELRDRENPMIMPYSRYRTITGVRKGIQEGKCKTTARERGPGGAPNIREMGPV